VAKEYADAARIRGCAFVPVILGCREEENARRMRSTEREEKVAAGKGMLLDTTLLREMRGRAKLCNFQCPEQLEMDISDLRPEEAANKIMKHVKFVMEEATATATE